jgi:hypothetical protein
MRTFKTHSHINENDILSVKLPKEWAEKTFQPNNLADTEFKYFL